MGDNMRRKARAESAETAANALKYRKIMDGTAARKRLRRATVATAHLIAVRNFLAMLSAEVGEGELPFAILYREYTRHAADAGLPYLTDTAFSLRLADAGCRRRTEDRRGTGKGRSTVYWAWTEAAAGAAPAAANDDAAEAANTRRAA